MNFRETPGKIGRVGMSVFGTRVRRLDYQAAFRTAGHRA
jgi:hypothetical protein